MKDVVRTREETKGALPVREDMVSVVIATRNRREALLTAVGSVLAQEGVHLDVQIYDDCSEDGTATAIRRRFSGVIVHEGPRRVERLKLRNAGVRNASSELVLFLDDDCYFTHPGILQQAVDFFCDDSTAVVCLPYVEPVRAGRQNYEWCSVSSGEEVGSFVACAALIRRSAYLSAGGFRELLVSHHEERDLALRLLDQGWRFVYAGGTPLVHCLNATREKRQQVKRYAANELAIWFFDCPLGVLPVRMGATLYNHLFRSFRGYPVLLKLAGFAQAVRTIGRYWAERSPVSMEAYRRYRRLPSHGPEEFCPNSPVPPPCRAEADASSPLTPPNRTLC